MSGNISDFNSEKMKRMTEKEDLLLFLKSIVDDLNTQE